MGDFLEIVKGKKKNVEFLGTAQVAKRLGLTSHVNVFYLIKSNKFPNAFQDEKTNRWNIPLDDLEVYEQLIFNSLSVTEAIEKVGISEESLMDRIYENQFPNCYRENNLWRIPKNDIADYQKKVRRNESISLCEAVKLLSLEDNLDEVTGGNYFPNAFKANDEWNIPISDIEEFRLRSLAIAEYVDLDKAADILQISPNQVFTRIKYRKFNSVFKLKGVWWISKNDIADQEVTEKKSTANTLTTREVCKRLGYSHSSVVNKMITREKRFPNAFKMGGMWRVPIVDVEAFEKSLEASTKKIDYTSEIAFAELDWYIDSIDIDENVKETKRLYIQFCLIQINKMNGTARYKRNRVRLFKSLYEKIINTIKHEIYLVSPEVITGLLDGNSILRQHEKKTLIVFLRYVYHQQNIEPDQEFSLISTTEKKSKQEMYSPKIFHEIYQYTKDIDKHTSLALSDRCYANMWVYTILLLTDFIRGQDLILNTPNIDLDTVDIYSFDWFIENKLSEYQSQTIINQLHIHFRYKRTSKTDELLTFIVASDLIVPLATALIISELHRRLIDSDLLLDSFLEGKFNDIRTQGKVRHRNFFNGMKSASEFKFSSLMMNRSVATYLFYSVTEEDGQDSDLALHLTQVSRSHKNPDTTSQYIQATNRDGSINRVSYNLFKRGHFGWLYNYLILYVSQFQETQDTLEQRSILIEQIRKEISPYDLESVAKFVNNSLTPVPLKNNNDKMETMLNNIYKKRQSVISKLKEYSKEEIREIIVRLAKGDLPSKNEHAQCLVSPNCKNPQLSNCFSCEYVIPGNLMLIQLNEELHRLIENIGKEENNIILQRESRFLMHALFIWKEARIEFGYERVKAYIDIEDTWRKIEKIAHKISIE